jgi:hypothetical protein
VNIHIMVLGLVSHSNPCQSLFSCCDISWYYKDFQSRHQGMLLHSTRRGPDCWPRCVNNE